jgi:hypothetical protein
MGPISFDWYRQRGLVKLEEHVQEEEHKYLDRRAGESYYLELITQSYSCGRIDVAGTSDVDGMEIAVPAMFSEDWARFGRWLDTLETDDVWMLDQLVELYERNNPPITWDTYRG